MTMGQVEPTVGRAESPFTSPQEAALASFFNAASLFRRPPTPQTSRTSASAQGRANPATKRKAEAGAQKEDASKKARSQAPAKGDPAIQTAHTLAPRPSSSTAQPIYQAARAKSFPSSQTSAQAKQAASKLPSQAPNSSLITTGQQQVPSAPLPFYCRPSAFQPRPRPKMPDMTPAQQASLACLKDLPPIDAPIPKGDTGKHRPFRFSPAFQHFKEGCEDYRASKGGGWGSGNRLSRDSKTWSSFPTDGSSIQHVPAWHRAAKSAAGEQLLHSRLACLATISITTRLS